MSGGTRSEYSRLIFQLYYKVAYQTAYYYSGNAHLAEEAAQEAIYKAIKNINQLKDPNKIESWIKTIAKHSVLDLINKHKKIINIEDSAHLPDDFDNTPEQITLSPKRQRKGGVGSGLQQK